MRVDDDLFCGIGIAVPLVQATSPPHWKSVSYPTEAFRRFTYFIFATARGNFLGWISTTNENVHGHSTENEN